MEEVGAVMDEVFRTIYVRLLMLGESVGEAISWAHLTASWYDLYGADIMEKYRTK